jgi:stage IV sporulation protein FB
MGLFNLLPIFPMDGGRLLRAALSLRFDHFTSTRAAVYLGRGLATAGALFAVYERQFLPALLFAFIFAGGELEYRSLRRRRQVQGLSVGHLVRRRFLQLPVGATVTDALDVLARSRPQDILLFDGERPVAAVALERIQRAVRERRVTDALADLAARPLTVLQADWPLEPFAETILNADQPVFPVYHRGVFVGVVEARGARESLGWLQAIRDLRGDFPP